MLVGPPAVGGLVATLRPEASKEIKLFEDAVESLYEASVSEDAWAVCLSVLCRATGAVGALFSDLDDPANALVSDAIREAHIVFRQRSTRENAFLDMLRAQVPRAGLFADDAFDGRIDREGHRCFVDLLAGFGLGRFAVYLSPPLFGTRFQLWLFRDVGAGPFAVEQNVALASLTPHATRALAVSGQVAIARSKDHTLITILDKMAYGAAVVGAHGRVQACNNTALGLLGDGLNMLDGRLVESFSNPRGLVEGLVRAALGEEDGQSHSALLVRPSGRKPVVLQALAFPRAPSWTGAARNETSLLMMIDTESATSAGQLSVVQSFGLTSAEARVAALVGAGFSPVEAAEQLGSAAGTVRTQLKNVFNKLDLKRQSELVRLMTKLEVLGS